MIKISKEVKVGLFALVGIIVFILGLNFLMGYSFFKKYTRYHVVYTNSGGVIKSTQVMINGFKIGQVEDVSFLIPGDPSKILVTLVVDGNVAMPIGTKAEIASNDILGSKIINLKLGAGVTYLNPDDTLDASIEEGLAESISNLVSPVKEKSEQVLATLDRVLQSMNDVFDSSGTQKLSKGVDDLTGTLHHIRNISAHLEDLTANEKVRISSMFQHTESILNNLRSNNDVLSAAMKNIKNITDSVAAADLKGTINNLNGSLGELQQTLTRINKGEGTLGQLATNEQLYQNLNSSSKELSALLGDMQKYPGRYFSISVFGGSGRAKKADKKRAQELKR